ncbi:MAG: hypothetical protein ACFBSE_05205 [Prochloraceae cyanobacterium]
MKNNIRNISICLGLALGWLSVDANLVRADNNITSPAESYLISERYRRYDYNRDYEDEDRKDYRRYNRRDYERYRRNRNRYYNRGWGYDRRYDNRGRRVRWGWDKNDRYRDYDRRYERYNRRDNERYRYY